MRARVPVLAFLAPAGAYSKRGPTIKEWLEKNVVFFVVAGCALPREPILDSLRVLEKPHGGVRVPGPCHGLVLSCGVPCLVRARTPPYLIPPYLIPPTSQPMNNELLLAPYEIFIRRTHARARTPPYQYLIPPYLIFE